MGRLLGVGFVFLWLCGFGACLLIAGFAFQTPDPFGFLAPADWREVWIACGGLVVAAAGTGACLSLAHVLLGRRRPWRVYAIGPGAGVALALFAIALGVLPDLHRGHGPDCATFDLAAERNQETRAWGVVKCGTLDGTAARAARHTMRDAPVRIVAQDGRVVRAELNPAIWAWD